MVVFQQWEVNTVDISFFSAFDHKDQMAVLYQEYNDLLIEADPSFDECLAMQNYDREIDELEIKFAPPKNALIIAFIDGKAAGCVGIKKFSDEICELKRLYVRPEFRNSGLGRLFCEKMIELARDRGYKKMYLDTLPALDVAVRMYYRLGFYEIDKYYDNPVEKVIYMCLDL